MIEFTQNGQFQINTLFEKKHVLALMLALIIDMTLMVTTRLDFTDHGCCKHIDINCIHFYTTNANEFTVRFSGSHYAEVVSAISNPITFERA